MQNISKAVILARGLGKRMRQLDPGAALDTGQSRLAESGLKAMIPLGRPFLDYLLSALADAGFGRVCLVIGPEHDAVHEYYTRTSPPRRVKVEFAIQQEPRGTADAVVAAEAFAGDEEFLVMNSDNYYPVRALEQLRELGEPGLALFEAEALVRESNIPAERVRAFAIGRFGADGYLQEITEKPDDAAVFGSEALVSMNLWRFPPAIFDICRRVPLSPRGEYELPQAVNEALRDGHLRMKVVRFTGGVLDLSRRADIAAVAERLCGVEPNP